jgi:hypothetical protein
VALVQKKKIIIMNCFLRPGAPDSGVEPKETTCGLADFLFYFFAISSKWIQITWLRGKEKRSGSPKMCQL